MSNRPICVNYIHDMALLSQIERIVNDHFGYHFKLNSLNQQKSEMKVFLKDKR